MVNEFQKQKIDRIYDVLDVEGTGALTFRSFLADAERGPCACMRIPSRPEGQWRRPGRFRNVVMRGRGMVHHG
jgi:hypothetical protein